MELLIVMITATSMRAFATKIKPANTQNSAALMENASINQSFAITWRIVQTELTSPANVRALAFLGQQTRRSFAMEFDIAGINLMRIQHIAERTALR